ncbi:2OG-Fe(II) oxygenase [Saccharospirillum salsuginis]|uniref:SM-20 n=1 Tax=Saccharospirillum salsuginis TaxID=418750 RepID=A0A918JZF3_9GAMM|nr:2OG-Fe(II) oxygenase [Saccharospirillum salsuginis]GGX38586.1 SM-20 [Saccharospirillum salsuginis]
MTTQDPVRPLWDYDTIANGLREQGWIHLQHGIDDALALALLQDIHQHDSEQWDPAGIGRRQNHHTNELIRRDSTHWLNGATEPQQRYLAATEALRLELNRRLLLGLFDYECHYARYDAGAFYRKHVDAFRGRSNRVLTTVTYLNPDWAPNAGGELVLYDEHDQELTRLSPTLGSMVIFLSEDFPHEVLAAERTRFSIAGWFRNNNSIQGVVDPSR